MIALTVETKTCSKCLRNLPIEEFQLRRENRTKPFKWRAQCRECYRDVRRASDATKRRKRIEEFVSKAASRRNSTEFLYRLACDVIRRFGSFEAFVAFWYAELQAARKKPGSRFVRLSCLAVLRVVEDGSAPLPPATSPDDLSGESLNVELDELAARLGYSSPGNRGHETQLASAMPGGAD